MADREIPIVGNFQFPGYPDLRKLEYRPEVAPGIGPCPFNWQDEETGRLRKLFRRFFSNGETLLPHEFEAVRQWGEYYINAPCWDTNPHMDLEGQARLDRIRARIKTVKTFAELDAWIEDCLVLGIDPY